MGLKIIINMKYLKLLFKKISNKNIFYFFFRNLKINFINFYSDSEYKKLCDIQYVKVKKIYPKSNIFSFSKDHLPEKIKKIAREYPKGYGLWIWKPYIIKKSLNKMNKNELLFYVDSRTDIPEKQILFLNKFFLSRNYDLLIWEMETVEKEWTSKKLLEFFKIENNNKILESPQLAATFLLIRKNKRTERFIERLYENMINNIGLLIDPDKKDENTYFIEHRHDQSFLSLLLKVDNTLKVKYIKNKDLRGLRSLHPHTLSV